MTYALPTAALATLLLLGAPARALAQESLPGASVEPLLTLAREHNPDYASMRFEAQAATERIAPAGALMDPKFSVEWMDITKA
ncbi:MAG: TolC family protein, partial [Rhodoferax sp.]